MPRWVWAAWREELVAAANGRRSGGATVNAGRSAFESEPLSARTLTHLSRRDPPSRVVREHPLEEVDRFGRSGAEEHAKIALRLLLERRAVAQFAEALRTHGRWHEGGSKRKEKRRTGHSASVGVPSAEKIMFSCSMSLSAAMNGTRSMSSAKMQPAAQTSTPVLYDRAPSSSSGHRYHLH